MGLLRFGVVALWICNPMLFCLSELAMVERCPMVLFVVRSPEISIFFC